MYRASTNLLLERLGMTSLTEADSHFTWWESASVKEVMHNHYNRRIVEALYIH